MRRPMRENFETNWLGVALGVVVGLVSGLAATWYPLPDPGPPPQREEIPLPRSELSSSLPGLPLPQDRREIIEAKPGHAAGHVLFSQPRRLSPGSYSAEMDLEVYVKWDAVGAYCVMDLLAGDHLVGKVPVTGLDRLVSLKFRSPATNGASDFILRLFCDGRETVVSLRRGPPFQARPGCDAAQLSRLY